MNNAGLVGKPHHFCEYAILPNHLCEIYEVGVLTGSFPLRAFDVQQGEETVRIRATDMTRGISNMLKLVCFVYLVDLVHLVSLVQSNKRDRPNKPNNGFRTLADFFSILLETREG